MDLIIIMPIAISMSRTHGYEKIVVKRPPGSLASPGVITSLLGHILIMLLFQVGSVMYLKTKPWFVPLDPKADEKNIKSMENTVLFSVASFQYIWMAMAFSISKPYRKPLHTNRWFLGCLVALILSTFYALLCPDKQTADILELWDLEKSFRYEIAVIVCFNLLVNFTFEKVIIMNMTSKKVFKMCKMKNGPKNRYKLIQQSLLEDSKEGYRAINIS